MPLQEIKTMSGQTYRGTVRRFEVNREPRVEITMEFPEDQILTCLPVKDETQNGFWTGNSEQLIGLVSQYFKVPAAAITGRARPTEVCFARWVCFQILRVNGAAYEEIGRQLKKDHGTVIYGIGAFWNAIEQSRLLKRRVETFLKSIGLNPELYLVKLSSKP